MQIFVYLFITDSMFRDMNIEYMAICTTTSNMPKMFDIVRVVRRYNHFVIDKKREPRRKEIPRIHSDLQKLEAKVFSP